MSKMAQNEVTDRIFRPTSTNKTLGPESFVIWDIYRVLMIKIILHQQDTPKPSKI